MSDEVTDFLRSVEQLKDRRLEEDEARSRELEEKILQEKRERQARRAERARSISPQKSSPANTPSPSHHHRFTGSQSDVLNPASPQSPTAYSSNRPGNSALGATLDYPAASAASSSPTKENESPFDTDDKTTGNASPARTPGLSWQRRPTSGSLSSADRPRIRPLSMVAAENAAARSSTTSANPAANASADDAAEPVASRDQIAQSLASKDPAWFRQTADRGLNSAAYRRSQVEDNDRQDLTASRTQLPGMARPPSTEPDPSSRSSAALSGTGKPGVPSPLILSPPEKLDPPAEVSMSGRTSPTRPLSPTKGGGGFVQSAMMKRNDSVKRWSVSSPSGLQRGDPIVAGGRAGAEAGQRAGNTPPTSTSRPSSSDGPSSSAKPQDETISTPARTKEPVDDDDKKTTTPTNQSKTMDPRRWSPTKSSWLEAALNKSESPKPKVTPQSNAQPAWMVELNKAKAQKATNPAAAESSRPRASSIAHRHEVKTGGLMRSTPMGATLPKLTSPTAVPAGLGIYHAPSASVSSNSGKEAAEPQPTPTTPSQVNFRNTLKHKPSLPSEVKKEDAGNELQNVFGSLRRARTQSYVAPDPLKDNILRGKSALNATGGPQPWEKKDDFKDAILQKKAQFKQAKTDGRGIATNAHERDNKLNIPEGVAKRLEMARTGSSRSPSPIRPGLPLPEVGAGARALPLESVDFNRSTTVPSLVKKASIDASAAASDKQPVPLPIRGNGISPVALRLPAGSALANRFNPALASMLARGPPAPAAAPAPGTSSSSAAPSTSSGAEAPPPGPGPQLTHMTKNRARGPRRKAPTNAPSVQQSTAAQEPAKPVVQPEISPLITTPKKPEIAPKTTALVDSLRKMTPEPTPAPSPAPVSVITPKKRVEEVSGLASPFAMASPLASTPIMSPPGPSKASGGTRPRSPTKIQEQIAAFAAKEQEKKVEEPISSPASSPRKLDTKRMSKFWDDTANTPGPIEPPRPLSPSKTGGGRPLSTPRPLSPQKTGGSSSRPLPPAPVAVAKIENPASAAVSPVPMSSPVPTAAFVPTAAPAPTAAPVPMASPVPTAAPVPMASPVPTAAPVPTESPVLTASPTISPTASSTTSPALRQINIFTGAPMLPPQSQRPGSSSAEQHGDGPNFSPLSSPIPSPLRSGRQAQEVTAVLKEFFGEERSRRAYQADAAAILAKQPARERKVNTLKAQLFHISSSGQKIPVPEYNERVLFEGEMYLCPHTFTDERGQQLDEVYFWVGDEVPESMVQDVQMFLHREARALGGRLVKMRQGKECAEFLQALGGVVTIRRGESQKFDSLAPSMFCGRRYLGQIVFDQVDFVPGSLCSGFPFLVARQGMCYLWKGKGSSIDELSCARLIGMDLALMGELIEVVDGQETSEFWGLFDEPNSKVVSADHWRLKPKYDQYCGRLFRSDVNGREQVVEIHPFEQRDLTPDGIYVLDAFFEMYIIVGHRSQTQYAAFRNALDFAQEYAILAASMEDRPFVPISTVVLEGIPRDLKSVFRKWRDVANPTRAAGTAGSLTSAANPSPIKRSRSLRIVPLTVALQALAD